MIKKRRIWLAYFILGILALSLRLWKIDHLPSVISHDEIFYPTQAKTLAVSGHGVNGKWQPFDFTPETELYAEFPGLVMMPAAKLFPNQAILATRITHVLLGTALIFILAALAYQLSKSHRVAFLTAFLACFNPWLFQFSRMGFDSMFSLFFYSTGILIFLKAKSWKKLTALAFFLMGFFQYQGLKIVFLPIVLLTGIFNLSRENFSLNKFKKNWKKELPTLTVMVLAGLIFIVYLFNVRSQSAGERLNFLVWSDKEYLEQNIVVSRQQGFNSTLNEIYPNKVTVIFEKLAEQYFNSLDLKQWFFNLEVVRNPFAVYQHGLFYWLDLPLIILGLIVIFSKNKFRTVAFFLLGLLLIAPLPSAVVSTGSWLVFRASFLVPIFLILMGFAAAHLSKKTNKYFFAFLVLAYLALIGRFFYQYFYIYPISGTRDQYFAERLVAQYIKRNPDKKILVSAPEPIFVFQEILIYNNLINKENISNINQAFQSEDYKLANFEVFGERCVPETIPDNTIYISHSNSRPCDGSDSPLRYTQIPSLIDGGGIYRIYNDRSCGDFSLNRFLSIREDLFDLDKLNNQEFCQNFIVRN
ncbi:MAG: Glycosyl transferase family 39 [Candidatus Pacebacteria bacterium GW2011_GWF2_38_9]|nr:MAG: Glycosyl transferase family 39 [candidate division TM6 bacterium GW2011_GWF2_28_16]KKQ10213.1 MAG: Glycosyl transferase family 39 [Candidatus Pacebacteria bacterium GW2011_GWF1_36_5]KKQ88827.1 MAG: Glycosyl transferase family 39 [Candidatus Pacebacteria bacterium GW2011_GWF2_38_9]HAZ73234.1 hypothetical protein [Candidatus Paceibacterota bacterium]